MNIVRYDPFRELRSLQDEMTRLFTGVAPAAADREDMMNGGMEPERRHFRGQGPSRARGRTAGNESRDDFELSFENNVLTLSGERKFEKKTEGDNYHRVERSYGSFTRSFTLPQTVTAEGATAEFENGVLHVTPAETRGDEGPQDRDHGRRTLSRRRSRPRTRHKRPTPKS